MTDDYIITVLPRSIAPRFLAYCQNSCLSRFPPLKIPRYTAKLSYRHPPQVFRHKRRKTNLNSPVSTAHNFLLTAVYWSVIMECQNWSSDTVIDLIVEGRNRWSVVLIRITTCIYFSSDYIAQRFIAWNHLGLCFFVVKWQWCVIKCRWNHGETFTVKIYKLGPKCRWNILIVGDNTVAKIIRVHIHVTV